MGVRSWLAQRFEPEVEQPAWAAAIEVLHDGDGIIRVPGRESIMDSHPFVKDAELSMEEARTAFDYLEHTGLIERVDETEDPVEYVISRDGFQTAHERELNARQWELDLTSAVVAMGLFIVTIINLLHVGDYGLSGSITSAIVGILFIGFLLKIPKYG